MSIDKMLKRFRNHDPPAHYSLAGALAPPRLHGLGVSSGSASPASSHVPSPKLEGYFDSGLNGSSASLNSPSTSPLPWNENGPTAHQGPDRRQGSVDRQTMDKSTKTINSLVATLSELGELNAATAKAQRDLAKHCKDLAGLLSEDMDRTTAQEDVIVNALLSASALFASVHEVTTIAGKKVAKESSGLRESQNKILKRISKDEKEHEDHVEQLEAKIRKAASAFEKSRKPSHRHSFDAIEAAATSERYLGSMSAWGAEIAQAKQSQACVRSIRRDSACRLVVRAAFSVADAEWRKSCDQVRRAGGCVGDLTMWSNFCATDAMPSTMPPALRDSDAAAATESASSSSFHTAPSTAGSREQNMSVMQPSPPRLQRSTSRTQGPRPPPASFGPPLVPVASRSTLLEAPRQPRSRTSSNESASKAPLVRNGVPVGRSDRSAHLPQQELYSTRPSPGRDHAGRPLHDAMSSAAQQHPASAITADGRLARPTVTHEDTREAITPRVGRPRTSPDMPTQERPIGAVLQERRMSADVAQVVTREHDVEATIRAARRASADVAMLVGAQGQSPRAAAGLQATFAGHEGGGRQPGDQQPQVEEAGASLSRNDSVESTASARSFVARMKELYLAQKAQVDELGRHEVRRRQEWTADPSLFTVAPGVAALASRYSSLPNTPVQPPIQAPKPRHVSESAGFLQDNGNSQSHPLRYVRHGTIVA